jgi:glycosyltransferase involved in cell wall biosynthesis
MRIQFVLEWPVMTGGVRVVYEHAVGLRARGHQVTILAPPIAIPRWGPGLERAWRRFLRERWTGEIRDGLRSYGLDSLVVPFDPGCLELVPEADAVVATAWLTAEWVAAMPERAGRKFYLVQQYEAWTESLRARVDATWRLPLRKIVISHWLQRLAAERFGEQVMRIPNGVDTRRFHPPPAATQREAEAGMLYEPLPWKGMEDGFAAIDEVARALPDARFLIFGRGRLRQRLPTASRYVRDPRQDELARLYGAAEIFMNPSHSEGFSLAILEAMACGCALVATAVGEVPEMGRPGEDYWMVPPRDSRAMGAAIIALLRDPARRRAMADAGQRLAASYTWGRATDMLENALGQS